MTIRAPDTTTTETKPPFCPYSDCVSWRFGLIGKLGGTTYWRCKKCGGEFPYDLKDG